VNIRVTDFRYGILYAATDQESTSDFLLNLRRRSRHSHRPRPYIFYSVYSWCKANRCLLPWYILRSLALSRLAAEHDGVVGHDREWAAYPVYPELDSPSR
jgi:hypothetical protein